MSKKYCMNCEQFVNAREFSILAWLGWGAILFIPCVLLGLVGAAIWIIGLFGYPIYHAMNEGCPICHCKDWKENVIEQTEGANEQSS